MSQLRETLKKVPGLRPVVIHSRAAAQATARGLRNRCGLNDRERIRALHNVERGRRGFVIGNGPSLKQLDLSKLRNEVTFGCNCAWLLAERTGWLPTYYCVEDCLVLEDNAEAIRDLKGPTKFLPRDHRHLIGEAEDIIYVEFQRGEPPGFPIFSDRCDEVVYFGGTVTYMMLQMAAWVGCNPIYLIGQDMNYQLREDQTVEGEVITSRGPDVNHFDPGYFGPGKRWHDPHVEVMQHCLAHAHHTLAARGVASFNATAGGKLETFPRIDFEQIFAESDPSSARGAKVTAF
jgi:hypothetical protein